jgi:class 3 adenylate cyclase
MSEERRLVTVLFADVVGSTAIGESLDPEDLRRLLTRFYDIAHRVVEGHAGTLEKFIGDAAMAIFGLPLAHDDDARRAIDAALELADSIRNDPILGEQLPIRIGINTGEVVASRERDRGDFIVTGDAVNVAARLEQAAEPWEILVSSRTASAAARSYEFGPPRELELKGKGAPVTALAVAGPSAARSPRTPLVGRDADLAQLDLVARRAFSERRPYLVSLIAPAGTGKSRLVEEFLDRLSALAPDALVAVAQCIPYGQALTYWPMRSLLRSLLGATEEADSPDELRGEIRSWLQGHGAERASETADVLAATVGASDTEVLDRSSLFAAWRETLELAAAERQIVLLIEVLHWSSDSLLDLIEFVLQPRADAPLLMLALSRPELLERRPAWGGGRRNHVSLALEPLDSASIEQLVQNILDGPAPELIPIVAQRSEGNPFYAGEIVRSLVEGGVDLRNPEAVKAAAAGLPDTVQATVLARLDALDPLSRRVVQLGSVFGRSFAVPGVAVLSGETEANVTAAVDRLLDRELLRPSSGGELVFRHILIRDVAFGTLPRAERAHHHAAAGHWLEERAAGREDELAELIAYHYREAAVLGEALGETATETREQAVRWLRRAAEVAGGARGVMEAVSHLRAAVALARPAEQAEMYRRMGEFEGAGDESVQAYAKAWQIGEAEGMPRDFLLDCVARQLMVACRWFASVARQPSMDEMKALIQRGYGWSDGSSPRNRARFQIALAFMPFWLRNSGVRETTEQDLAEAHRNVMEGLAIAEELDDAWLLSAALDAMTSEEQHSNPEAARDLSLRRVAMGARLPVDERLDALNMVAWSAAHLGALPEVVKAATDAMRLVQPGQNIGFALGAPSWNAYAQALIGDWGSLSATVEELRKRWLEVDRPAWSFCLQGFFSGTDWARNRGDEELVERWRAPALEIIGRYDSSHQVAALRAIAELDLDGVVAIVLRRDRFPDRAHYVEHALAICADRAQQVPLETLDDVLEEAAAGMKRVVEAQARRLRGILRRDPGDLSESLRIFEEIGAGRYASRVRRELGLVLPDDALRQAGDGELERLGELDRLAGMGVGP